MRELGELVRVVLLHLREQEREAARQAVQAARVDQERVSFRGRARAVAEINQAILQTKRDMAMALEQLRAMSGAEDVGLEFHVVGPIEQMFRDQLGQLRREKAKASRPPRR